MAKRSLKPPRRKPAMAKRLRPAVRGTGHAQRSDRGAIHCAAAAAETCGVFQARSRRCAGCRRGVPQRARQLPVAFAVAAAESKPVAPPSNRDLIVALLKRANAPRVITRGLQDASHDDARADGNNGDRRTSRSARCGRRARRAPLPPLRPSDLGADAAASEGATIAPRSDAAPAPSLKREPFGALVTDAFSAAPPASRGDRAEAARPRFGELSFLDPPRRPRQRDPMRERAETMRGRPKAAASFQMILAI